MPEELKEEKTEEEEVEKVEEEADDAGDSTEEKDKQIEDLQKELAGLKNKDYNFKKLRDMSDSEKKELTDRERDIIARQEKLEEDTGKYMDQRVQDMKDDALDALVGSDVELRKKITHNFDRINDKAESKDEIYKKMREAYNMTGESKQSPNSFRNAVKPRSSAYQPEAKATLSGDQKNLAKKLGVSDKDIETYDKKRK